MAFQSIPSEILDQVFIKLPQYTTEQCMLVCKSWYPSAIRAHYSHVTLTKENIDSFMNTLSEHHRQGSRLTVWIRHLRFDFQLSTTLSQKEFSSLIQRLTNLKTINMESLSTNTTAFLDILYRTGDRLHCIEDVKLGMDISKEGKELYFKTMYAHRDTVTHLHLSYLKASYTMNGISGNYAAFLPHFRNLNHLSVFNDLLTGDRYMIIYNVLDLCPTLSSFELRTIRHFPDASQPKLMKLMERDLSSKISLHHKNSNLKSVCFHIRELDKAYMKYLIHYTRLDIFKLTMIDVRFFDWISTKQVMIKQFATYLSTVKDVDITAYSPTRVQSSRTRLFDNEQLKMHWDFLQRIIGNRKLYCKVYISISAYDQHDNGRNFRMEIVNNTRIILRYVLRPEFPHNNLTSLLTQHHEQCGPNIMDLIYISDAARYSLEDCIGALQYALSNCSRLKSFTLNRSRLFYKIQSVPYPYDCHFDKKWSNVESQESMKIDEKDRLNHVLLKDAFLSNFLVVTLQHYLPYIKVIKLVECTLPTQTNGSMILNLKRVKHLHYLELDYSKMKGEGLFSIIFQVTGGETTGYSSKGNELFTPCSAEDLVYGKDMLIIQCNTIDIIAIGNSRNNAFKSTMQILKLSVNMTPQVTQ